MSALVGLETGWGTGVDVVQRYVIVFFLSVSVYEGSVILQSGFLKGLTFSRCILPYASHLLLPFLVVAGFLLPCR